MTSRAELLCGISPVLSRATLVLLFCAGVARGQATSLPAPSTTPSPSTDSNTALGPLLPPSPEVVQMKSDLDAALRQLKAQQQDLAALRARLDEEHQKLEAETARSNAVAEALPYAVTDRIAAFFHDHPVLGTLRDGLSISGFVQADYYAWNQSAQDQLNTSTGAPLNTELFAIRRARLHVEADYGWVGGAIEFDGNTINGTTARLIDAEASVRLPSSVKGELPYIGLTIGLFKTPFGFEVLESDTHRLFLERSLIVRALFPGEYDLGARVGGGWRFLRYSVGLMNGDPLGEKAFPGRDPQAAKDIVGRFGVETPIYTSPKRHGAGFGIRAGVSGLAGHGFHSGSPATKDVLVWRDANEDGIVELGELQVIPGSAATASQSFERDAIGGDIEFMVQIPVVGRLSIYGEMIDAKNLDRAIFVADPIATGRDLREFGYYVGFTQELTRYGQVGLRYDTYNPDADARTMNAGNTVPADVSYWSLDAALAVRYPPYGRLIFEYDHNINHNGRDLAGNPINLAADAFSVRGEVVF